MSSTTFGRFHCAFCNITFATKDDLYFHKRDHYEKTDNDNGIPVARPVTQRSAAASARTASTTSGAHHGHAHANNIHSSPTRQGHGRTSGNQVPTATAAPRSTSSSPNKNFSSRFGSTAAAATGSQPRQLSNNQVRPSHSATMAVAAVRTRVRGRRRGPCKCPLCAKVLSSSMSLENHMRIHSGEKPFSCVKCNRSFHSRKAMTNHRSSNACNGLPSRKRQNANASQFRQEKQNVQQRIHSVRVQPQPQPKASHSQSFRAPIGRELPAHINRKSRLTKGFTCPECGKLLGSKVTLDDHMNLHTGLRPYSCTHCKATFQSSRNWYDHIHKCEFITAEEIPQIIQGRNKSTSYFKLFAKNLDGGRGSGGGSPSRKSGHVVVQQQQSAPPPQRRAVVHHVAQAEFANPPDDRVIGGNRRGDYPCDVCSKILTSENNLRDHRRTHTGERPFVCKFCPSRYFSSLALNTHVKNHHTNKNGKVVGVRVTSQAPVANSPVEVGRAQNRNLTARISHQVPAAQSSVNQWQAKANANSPAKTAKIIPNTTNTSLNSSPAMAMSFNGNALPKWFVCGYCQKTLSSPHTLRSHILMYHKYAVEGSPPPSSPFRPTASASSSNSNYTSDPLQQWSPAKTGPVSPFTCPYPSCGKVLKNKRNFDQHIRFHTGEKPYSCPECDEKFTTSLQYYRHRPSCPGRVSFEQSQSLPISDNTEQEWEEEDGGTTDQLEEESYVDEDDEDEEGDDNGSGRGHPCGFCQKLLSSKKTLADHIRMHTGERPYKCEYCPATFHSHTSKCRHRKLCKARRGQNSASVRVTAGPGGATGTAKSNRTSQGQSSSPSPSKTGDPIVMLNRIETRAKTAPTGSAQRKNYSNVDSMDLDGSNDEEEYILPDQEIPSPSSGLGTTTGDDSSLNCPYCQKLMSSKDTLADHVRLHTGERPYKCQKCPANFCSSKSLNAHLKFSCGKPNARPNRIWTARSALSKSRKHGVNIQKIAFKFNKLQKPQQQGSQPQVKNSNFQQVQLSSKSSNSKSANANDQGSASAADADAEADAIQAAMQNFKCKTCPVCKRTLSNHQLMTNHLRLHTGEKPYRCNRCPQSYTSATSLYKHKQVRCAGYPDGFVGSREFPSRGQSAESAQSQVRHVRRVFSPNQTQPKAKTASPARVSSGTAAGGAASVTVTKIPFQRSPNRNIWPRVDNDVSRTNSAESPKPKPVVIAAPTAQTVVKEKPKFPCSFCDEVLSTNRDLEDHVRHHTGEKPFNCPHCSESFHSSRDMIAHRRRCERASLTCTHCSKVLSTKQNLEDHVRRHTGELPFPCTRCSERFYCSRALVSHRKKCRRGKGNSRKNDESRDEEMDVDGDSDDADAGQDEEEPNFEPSAMASRESSNSGPTSLSTSTCPSPAPVLSAGTEVVNEDSNASTPSAKPGLQCPHCDKILPNKFTMVFHIQSHTAEKPFQCSHCPERFFSKLSLGSHEKLFCAGKKANAKVTLQAKANAQGQGQGQNIQKIANSATSGTATAAAVVNKNPLPLLVPVPVTLEVGVPSNFVDLTAETEAEAEAEEEEAEVEMIVPDDGHGLGLGQNGSDNDTELQQMEVEPTSIDLKGPEGQLATQCPFCVLVFRKVDLLGHIESRHVQRPAAAAAGSQGLQ